MSSKGAGRPGGQGARRSGSERVARKQIPAPRPPGPLFPAPQAPGPPASPLRTRLLAARPRTLPAATAPVLLGTMMAASDGAAHLPAAACALAGALLIQIGTNYYNDAADFERGADTPARRGPTRAVASGMVSPRAMK